MQEANLRASVLPSTHTKVDVEDTIFVKIDGKTKLDKYYESCLTKTDLCAC